MTDLKTRVPIVEYAIDLAWTASTRSEDPYHRVGTALIRHDNTVAALGYNGAPPKVDIDWSDRDARRRYVIHAEANALRYVRPDDVAMLASTMMPCMNCVLLAAAYRIPLIVYAQELDASVYDVPAITALAAVCGITLQKWRT